MIPIEDSFLYVEPVFLQGAAGGLPELKRVIVATGNDLAMEKTLEEAMAVVFGSQPPEPTPTPPPGPTPTPPGPTPTPGPIPPGEIADLMQSIQNHEVNMQQYAAEGNWAAWGEEKDAQDAEIQQLLNLISDLIAEQ